MANIQNDEFVQERQTVPDALAVRAIQKRPLEV